MPIADPLTTLPIKVAVEGVWYAQPWANVFHLAMEGVNIPDDVLLSEVAEDVLGLYDTTFSPLIGAACQFTRAVASTVGPGASSGEHVPLVTLTGARGGSGLPGSVAQVITWITGSGGRSGRGRMYLPGMTDTAISSSSPNVFSTAYVADCIAAGNQFRLGIPGLTNAASRAIGLAVYSPTTSTLRLVSAVNATAALDTQRRRVRN